MVHASRRMYRNPSQQRDLRESPDSLRRIAHSVSFRYGAIPSAPANLGSTLAATLHSRWDQEPGRIPVDT